jgi:hypothetical protein
MTQQFDAAAELTSIQEQRKTMRKLSYRKSRLLKHRAEIVALKKSGASLHDIALWLRQKKRIKVSHTTVMRFLAKLPEVGEKNDAQL